MESSTRLFLSVATGALCTLAGLLFEIIFVAIVCIFVRWPNAAMIVMFLGTMFVGGFTAFLIRRSTRWPASSIAGAVGSLVAAWFCLACGEHHAPGSLEWAIKGGLYGAAWGLPFGALLGPIGLLRRNRRSSASTSGEQ